MTQPQNCTMEDNRTDLSAHRDPAALVHIRPSSAAIIGKRAQKLADFYKGKRVLVTGATGFIGKVTLFKIIKSLPDCERIFVLLRPKRGMTPQQRFNQMLNEEPFAPTKIDHPLQHTVGGQGGFVDPSISVARDKPLDWSKITAVEGDMSAEGLGLSDEVSERLCREVHVVFNIAASVQFDAPLKQNLRDNFLGVSNLLHLATKFEALVSFVHVSTFYTNCHISHIEEKVLPMNRDCEKMAELISWMPDSLCDTIGPHIMESRPNTYVFTKAMAENLVLKYQGRLPLAIVRPSIVTPSIKEPMPGWVDNVNGPMGLGVLASLGILRNIDWNYHGVADLIPVDYVVNTMLAVAERTTRLEQEAQDQAIRVYNCSSSSLNPTRWGEGFTILREESLRAPPYKMLRVPIKVPQHKRASKIGMSMSRLNELLFAYLVDFILMICGQKQILTKLTAKLHHGYDILRPFTTNEYTCSNENLLAAFEELDPDDKKEFNFDLKEIDWRQSFINSYYGARRRILKENCSNIPASLFKFKILMTVEFLFRVIFLGLLSWAAYRVSSSYYF